MRDVDFNEAKFRELILYVCSKMKDDPTFGATVLNKVLFWADHLHFQQHGTAITGAEYWKLDYGPAPAKLVAIRNSMVSASELVIKETSYLGRTQKRPVALREPNLSLFEIEEVDFVDQVVDSLRNQTAKRVSDVSHEVSLAWQLAEIKEVLPYQAVFLANKVTTADREFAAKIAQDRNAA